MKKTLVLVAVLGVLGSAASKGDSFDTKTTGIAKVPAHKTPARAARAHIYITNVATTGSHLPLVVTRYGKDVYANSSLAAYTSPELDQTGQLNVGGELAQRDPAISSAAHGTH